jgi:hypothetical protein
LGCIKGRLRYSTALSYIICNLLPIVGSSSIWSNMTWGLLHIYKSCQFRQFWVWFSSDTNRCVRSSRPRRLKPSQSWKGSIRKWSMINFFPNQTFFRRKQRKLTKKSPRSIPQQFFSCGEHLKMHAFNSGFHCHYWSLVISLELLYVDFNIHFSVA